MASDTILYEAQDGIATLTLNRPAVMNAINGELLHRLEELVSVLRFDAAVRVAIITGGGPKAFCAGADLKARATMTPEEVKSFLHTMGSLFQEIEQLDKAVIALLNGVALGGGLELALTADIRMAADTAIMGLPETGLAIIPGAGGTQRLPRLVGKGRAKELIFTGQRIDARQAMAMGLVNRVFPPDQLMAEGRKMATTIAQAGPIAIQQAKSAIDRGLETDLHTGLAIESKAYWVCVPTQDRLEGLAAFKEKRKPVYKGR
jgi:enoyl-CoA hydratase/carnithine racemase